MAIWNSRCKIWGCSGNANSKVGADVGTGVPIVTFMAQGVQQKGRGKVP